MSAKRPLVITTYLGRNRNAPPLLEELCDKLPIGVVEMVGSDVCIRSDHEAYLGVTVTTHPAVLEADVILILDCDVPWIPTAGKPQRGMVFPAICRHLLTGRLKEPRYSTSTLIHSSSKCHVGLGMCPLSTSLTVHKQYSPSTLSAGSKSAASLPSDSSMPS